MTTPRKLEILRKAKGISLERQIRAGLPAITPTEKELKETGAFQEAQIDLMRVDQEALSQQMSYLQSMAGEMKLMVLPKRGLVTLKRETGYEWTNGWTKHEPKRKKKTTHYIVVASGTAPTGIETQSKKEAIRQLKKLRKRHPTTRSLSVITSNLKTVYKEPLMTTPKPVGIPTVNLRKPLNIGSAIRGAPKPKIEIKMPPIKIPTVKPKRRKSHVERAGKTMRALRKVNGVKVFAFPDDVWKVRKPRKRKRK